MQHCFSRSLHKYPFTFFLKTLCLLRGQRYFSPVFIRVSTSMSHLIIVTNIIGSANYQIVDYPFPKISSIQFLTSRMYILHSRKWSYFMLAPPYKNLFFSQGQHLAKWLFLSILSFLFQPTDFPSTFHFSKISCFLLWNTTTEIFRLSSSLSAVKVPFKW